MLRKNGFTAQDALNPSTIEVDERTVLDRLSFVANFSKFINFYDKNNQKNGSWQPFFLKDSTILLAAISQMDYTAKHMLFLMLSKKLSTKQTCDFHDKQHNALLEQLFNLIQSIFTDANDWLIQMENDLKTYQLKEFVKKNISLQLAPLLWQFFSLRQTVAIACQDISEPDYLLFENFQPLWKIHARPTMLGKLTQDANIFSQLQAIYQPVFSFYVQVITTAKDTFDELKGDFNNPPDTALLIAFVELMEVHRRQLNEMTQRHLDFYYRDILKQNNKAPIADETLLFLTLAKNTASFYLPVSTQFNAGLDEQKQPVVYESIKPQMLNHATIKYAMTLCYCPDAETAFKKLHKTLIKNPAQLLKMPTGDLQSWSLLGDDKGDVVQQGFAFASPMLNLQSGLRHITITFSFTENYEFDLHGLQNSQAYLSTQKDWFNVPFNASQPKANQLELRITLTPTDSAITPFTKNPDGFSSKWALFKLILSDSVNLLDSPSLKNIEIVTHVEQFSTFELYNDFGKLADSGFLPFGSIPAQGNNFYFGSAELFAKPLTELELRFNWDTLPASMEDYYAQYNDFLAQQHFEVQVDNLCKFIGNLTPKQKNLLCHTFNKIFADNHVFSKKNLLKLTSDTLSIPQNSLVTAIAQLYPTSSNKLTEFLNAVAHKIEKDNPLKNYKVTPNQLSFFTNRCFKVIFSIWVQNQWQKVLVEETLSNDTIIHSDKPYWISLFNTEILKPVPLRETSTATAPSKVKPKTYGLKNLFGMIKKAPVEPIPPQPTPSPVLVSHSHFLFEKDDFNQFIPAPDLLLQPLDFTKTTKSGFINMSLQQPVYGFGNSLYAQVVTNVAQQNAYQLIKLLDNTNGYTPKPQPNPPYVPKISEILVEYRATQVIDFSTKQNYPFEYFYYDSFNCNQVYDSIEFSETPAFIQTPLPSTTNELKLFAGIASSASLYLCLDAIEPPCNVSFYIELSQLSVPFLDNSDVPPAVNFYYLSNTGWKPLKILIDETDQFSCSGLIEIFIAQDICANNPFMPESGYWLAMTSNNPATDFAKVLYLNTQAIKVKRLSTSPEPKLDANKITALVTSLPQIDTVSQPFASFNGMAKETNPAFYQRVSQRIKTKDRASNFSDFESMAFEALPALYFCKHITTQSLGEVCLGLVKGYTNSLLSEAYYPAVSRFDIDKITLYFSSRISPFVRLKFFNLSHESVTIKAELKFTASTQINLLCEQISQQLNIYLSPWIESEQPQMNIDEGLTPAAIIDYLKSFSEVEEVHLLEINTNLQPNPTCSIIFPAKPDGLFVSAKNHEIKAAILDCKTGGVE